MQIVTNDLSLAILKEMRCREISPSDLASTMKLPKTTVQASIMKLLRTGIVTQEARVDDGRSVIYRINAAILFSSDTDIEWQLYARLASTERIINDGRCTSREDLSLYGVSITESGLNIVQGLFDVGSTLVSGNPGKAWWDRTLADMQAQCGRHGVSMQVSTEDGLDLVFESPDKNISDLPLLIVPTLGAVISNSREILGYNLVHDVNLKVLNDGHLVKMKINRFQGQEFYNSYDHVVHRELNDFRIEDPFAIYSINKVATLFTNPTMMRVLFSLSDKDMSVNELEDETGMSKATIYASLTKLSEMGAVAVNPESGCPKKYTLLADPILYCTEPEVSDCDMLLEIIRRFQSNKIDYYSAVISLSMEAFRCMGIHFDKMFVRSGASTARTVIKLWPDIEPERFLDVACSMVSAPDSAEIVSKIPLKVRVIMSPDTLWEYWPSDFVRGFIIEGLKELTGDYYKVSVETLFEKR